MGTMVLKTGFFALVAYVGIIAYIWWIQDQLVFKPKHYEVLPTFERYRWDPSVNGVKLQGWFIDKGFQQTVIYHGGNAEDLAGHCNLFYDELKANALLVNYRGYGESEGKPSEKEMIADCISIFDRFCAEKKRLPKTVFLMGRSLGSGISVQVAAARPDVAGVILVTPYESLAAIAKLQYPWIPIDRILRHTFRAIDYAPKNQMPALVLLAEFDEVIPTKTGRKLGTAWGGPKEIITLPMDHKHINEHPAYFEAINRFITP